MSRTKDELLLACVKQFEHIEDVLGYNRLSTTRSLINEINQALNIPDVKQRFTYPKGCLTDLEWRELVTLGYVLTWGYTDNEAEDSKRHRELSDKRWAS